MSNSNAELDAFAKQVLDTGLFREVAMTAVGLANVKFPRRKFKFKDLPEDFPLLLILDYPDWTDSHNTKHHVEWRRPKRWLCQVTEVDRRLQRWKDASLEEILEILPEDIQTRLLFCLDFLIF